MIKISIKDAQIGMVAAEPIKTPLGRYLHCPAHNSPVSSSTK